MWKRVLEITLLGFSTAFLLLSIGVVVWYKYRPVNTTPLMLKRSWEYGYTLPISHKETWITLSDFSPELVHAVIQSEDARFWQHNGFDYEEISKMLEQHKNNGTIWRGCSTLSQQTAKNVFTLGSNTYFRKAIEAYFTVLIEVIWGKERILEVYLNIAETGAGLYGLPAASRTYYHKDVGKVNLKEACALAICLPNPLHRDPQWAYTQDAYHIEQLYERCLCNYNLKYTLP